MAAYVAKNNKSVLPKSYEDAKVSKTQRMTHEEILALGHTIFERNNQNQELSLKEELSNLRDDLLQSFEKEKMALMQEESRKAKSELEIAMNEAKVAQEKAVKQESERVIAKMAEVARKQVEDEHKAGDIRLEEALKRVMAGFKEEKASAITNAQREEQNQSMDKINALMKQHEKNIVKLKNEAEIAKKNALEDQRHTMERAKEEALQNLKCQMEREAEMKLMQLANKHKVEIDMKINEINEQEQHKEELNKEILHLQELRKETEEKVAAILDSYQNFINCQPGFSQGQADFLLKDFMS